MRLYDESGNFAGVSAASRTSASLFRLYSLNLHGRRRPRKIAAPLRRPCHTPIGGIAQRAQRIEIAANLIDQGVFGIGFQVKRSRNWHSESRRATTRPRLPVERLAVPV